jgi:hypothetical protein
MITARADRERYIGRIALKVPIMAAEDDFAGDQCIVLPKGYLESVEAAVDIHEDALTGVVSNLEVDSLTYRPRFFRGCLLAALLFGAPALWTVCL